MAGSQKALLIATDIYSDPTFRRLRAPAADSAGLGAVLSDPAIGDYTVDALHNAGEPEATRAIEDFFASAGLEDLLLLYVSGHGVKDDDGRLHLAVADSRHDRLGATSVPAQFIRDQMRRSRARRIMLWLDCCYAGAFPGGMRSRAGEQVDVLAQLRGRGCAVMTSSSALEYAYETGSGDVTETGTARPSVFTGTLIDGLRTGEADRGGDGLIDIDELYDYAYKRVQAVTPGQVPQKIFDLDGPLYVARSVRGRQPDTVLPPPSAPVGLRPGIRRPLRSRQRRLIVGAALAALTAAAATLSALLLTSRPAPPRPPSPVLRPLATFTTQDGGAHAVAFSPDGHILASGYDGGTIRLWDIARPAGLTSLTRPVGSAREPGVMITSVAFSPDGHTLATSDGYGHVWLWNITDPARPSADSRIQESGTKSSGNVGNTVAFSPDSHVLAIGDGNGTVRLWDVTQPAHPTALTPPIRSDTVNSSGGLAVDAVAFSPDAHLLVSSGGRSGDLRLWDITRPSRPALLGRPLALSTYGSAVPTSAAFSPPGNLLAGAGGSFPANCVTGCGTIRLWSIGNPAHPSALSQTLTPPDTTISSLAFSPDGRALAVAIELPGSALSNAIELWDAATPRHPALLGKPVAADDRSADIGSVAFSPDGRIVAAAEDDDPIGHVQIWTRPGPPGSP